MRCSWQRLVRDEDVAMHFSKQCLWILTVQATWRSISPTTSRCIRYSPGGSADPPPGRPTWRKKVRAVASVTSRFIQHHVSKDSECKIIWAHNQEEERVRGTVTVSGAGLWWSRKSMRTLGSDVMWINALLYEKLPHDKGLTDWLAYICGLSLNSAAIVKRCGLPWREATYRDLFPRNALLPEWWCSRF